MKKKFKENKTVSKSFNSSSLFIRYGLILLFGLFNLSLFYFIFTSLTVYSVYFILNLFFEPFLSGTTIFLGEISLEIIPACVGGSAYYLLFILNLSIPNLLVRKRLKMIFSSSLFLLILNVLRIVFLSLLAYNDSSYFDLTHKIFWYLLSTVFVIGIWFWEVTYFKIKEIPLYSDLKELYSKSIFKQKKKLN
jgi:exosortase/archaeosortase family protein